MLEWGSVTGATGKRIVEQPVTKLLLNKLNKCCKLNKQQRARSRLKLWYNNKSWCALWDLLTAKWAGTMTGQQEARVGLKRSVFETTDCQSSVRCRSWCWLHWNCSLKKTKWNALAPGYHAQGLSSAYPLQDSSAVLQFAGWCWKLSKTKSGQRAPVK